MPATSWEKAKLQGRETGQDSESIRETVEHSPLLALETPPGVVGSQFAVPLSRGSYLSE